ncbi:putative phenol 2-monooxygenase [Aspergillus vadensis CBS 113365]|uniref:Phenol hydroxylase n=1 Tax=Aspergillus vadensis (strain CBS 113365 / IMI 142717 / IBT 24658) TaxID=1448311 RepID=A0A319BE71_ASPVC|nr:phenol hydroxylase [Aspergillus vadensis CBS 113365]PYH64223.1 phenol hydroxylase [Aspergillus vadensis CBS 113365]
MTVSAESTTDVQVFPLIIGAGPSGLAVAYWMAQYGINARIIDKRSTKIFRGHADGLRGRTLELLDSMGIAHRILQEGYHGAGLKYWRPDGKGGLKRAGQLRSTIWDSSPYRMALLSQGRIERFFLDVIRDASNIDVERGVIGESLGYDESLENDPQAYPITIKLRTLSEEEATPVPNPGITPYRPARDDLEDLAPKRKHDVGTHETVRAKYLIGCDGAHSWTRKQLNIPFEGSHTDHIWGVMDVVPITDFPDIRWPSSIDSPHGHLLVITREDNVVRFYVPLQEEDEITPSFDRSAVTLDMLRERVKSIMSPFSFDFKICHWWAAYQVGRRLAPAVNKGRMYLVGDAVHTHSPKIGLGMNMSIQDGFNLGWKLALVVKEMAPPSILSTYKSERHQLAKMLLEFDQKWAAFFLKQKKKQHQLELDGLPEANPEDIQAMQDVFRENEMFAEGHVSFYKASPIVDKDSTPVAKHLTAGERFPQALIRKQADGQPWWTSRLLNSDGRFRILLLVGDCQLEDQKSRILALNGGLSALQRRFTPPKQKLDSVIEVKAIHSAPLDDVELSDFPPILRQFDETTGWDYSKVWSDSECFWDERCKGNAYEIWGVDRSRGAMVALRPDQYIGWIGELDDVAGVTKYFEGFLREPRPEAVL